MKVSISELEQLCRRAILGYGYDEMEAETILEILLYAQLRGNNQGIVKLIGPGIPKDPDAREIEVAHETKLSMLLNGNKNAGMVVLKRAADLACERAIDHGFGMVGTYNTCTSTGAIGFYARALAENGLIGLVFAGSPPTVATYGSHEPVFGTNPIAVGIPAQGTPIVLDMATSAMAWYGLLEAKASDRPIPDNVAYDKNGQLTTDAAEALGGAILPFDRSYKGAGLALIVEILTGPLVSASFAGLAQERNWGNLILALQPDLLVDGETFRAQVTELVQRIKSKKRVQGVDEIFIPGERGDRLARERVQAGALEIEDNLYNELQKVVAETAGD